MLRRRIMSIDFSWEHAVQQYFSVYQRVGGQIEVFSSKNIENNENGHRNEPEAMLEMPSVRQSATKNKSKKAK
jgi:hypothetical protein